MFLTLCLDSARLEVSRRFYERLGLTFSSEQHGPGAPLHFAAVLSQVPVEIYPTLKSLPPEDHIFIGFAVDDPVSLRVELIKDFGGKLVDPPVPLTTSGITTLRDPTGLLVRLFPGTS